MEINAANRLKASVVIEAAPVESADHATYMKSFYSQLKKKVFVGGAEKSKDAMKFVKIKGFLAIKVASIMQKIVVESMKSLGWKKTAPKTRIKNTTVYARQDGSWPILCTPVGDKGEVILTLAAVDNVSEF